MNLKKAIVLIILGTCLLSATCKVPQTSTSNTTPSPPPKDNYGTPVVPQQVATNIVTTPPNTKKDVGEIGDVKYSVLPSAEFNKENGEGWLLLTGQEIDSHWGIFAYRSLFRNNKLPDAQGVFLRGMMVSGGRTDGNEGNPEGQGQAVGEYKKDAVGKHDHKYHYPSYHVSDKLGGGSDYKRVLLDIEGEDRATSSNPVGETRPKNIALYIYIKIFHAK